MNKKQLPDGLNEEIKKLVQQLLEKNHRPASEIVMDDVDLRNMLKISRRTALNYRQQWGLKFYKIENKIFYFLSDVIDFIKSDKPKNDQA
ncbi:helix-turn-helix domain-containing protein [Lacibacter sediminis]|uniref:Helix-turn-helix domain-containing protein n=1 Tax=Lacibacter sediminis TaxID=2760713 RepID=A0A7G5XK45_9BACT|nr:helix-turn-helix domain-containing protein [Lacibacter sediminis]QNA45848.1 helix-turn-helix domain-containing protein [Lacibacter sediminis]